MSKKLRISDELSLPIDIASQAVAILGIRGSGKTNTAGVMAEELLDAGQPIVFIDPTDASWGLRSGYEVLIFGGAHGDIPLQETDGKALAEFQVQEQVPFILSLRHLRKGAQRRFVTEFCEELYHLKGKDEYRSPLTVFIDEAPLFVPQKVMGETARTVGAVEDLIARGRNAGFGVVLISQRSATINKDVLTQCDTIVSHRLTSPQDRKALAEWFEENASTDRLKEILGSLATMRNGQAWVWGPALSIIEQVQIRLRRTFDSSATPKPGKKPRTPKSLKEIDLNKLKGKLAAAVEQAKANDPTALKAKIRELEKQLATRPKESVVKEVEKIVEVPVLKNGQLDRTHKAADRVEKFIGTLTTELTELRKLIAPAAAPRPAPKPAPVVARPAVSRPSPAPRQGPKSSDDSVMLGKCERSILQVLSQYPEEGCKAGKITLLTGYRYSGGFQNSLSALRNAGLIEGGNTETMKITEAGLACGPFNELPQGKKLVELWLNHRSFGKCERAILAALLDHPDGMNSSELCEATGYAYSGGFQNSLSNLRTAGVLVGKNTETMKASDELLDAQLVAQEQETP